MNTLETNQVFITLSNQDTEVYLRLDDRTKSCIDNMSTFDNVKLTKVTLIGYKEFEECTDGFIFRLMETHLKERGII